MLIARTGEYPVTLVKLFIPRDQKMLPKPDVSDQYVKVNDEQ